MKLTGIGKFILFILAIGVAIGGWRFWQQKQAPGASGSTPGAAAPGLSTPGTTTGNGNALTGADNEILFLITGSKKGWVQNQVARFNAAQNGKWKIVTQTAPSREGMHAILKGDIKPVLWSPDGAMWPTRLAQVWKAQYSTSLVDANDSNARRTFLRTPLVFLTTRQKAKFLRPILGGAQPWLGLRDLSLGRKKVPWGEFKFSHADPIASNSGMMLLGLILYDYAQREGRAGNIERLGTDAKFLNYLRELEKKMVYDGPAQGGSSALAKAFLADPSRYDAIVAYENVALEGAAKNPELAVIYPSPTALSEQSVTLLSGGWITPAQREGALAFLTFLGSSESLQDGIKSHFRPAQSDGDLSLNPELARFSGQGFQQSYSAVELPGYKALNETAFQWRLKVAKKAG